MDLFAFAVAGSLGSLLLMAGGFVWLGARRQFEVARMPSDEAGAFVMRGWRGWRGRVRFRGLATGMSICAEKPTREIVALLRRGRWAEGLPWAMPALGALSAFFFWSLLIGVVVGLRGVAPWGMAAFFFLGGLSAAWPRR